MKASEICVIRSNGGLYPSTTEDFEKIMKPKSDELIIEIKQKRNVKFHRKFFALLNYVFERQEKYKNIEDLRVEVLLRSGEYHEHLTLKGEIIYMPNSMSFNSMKQADFDQFYSNAIDVCLKYFCQDQTKEEIEQILNFL